MHNNNYIYNYSGFLLIDLVISIGIFSGVSILLAYANWQIIKQEREIALFRQAINISHNLIEEINAKKNYQPSTLKTGIFTIKTETLPTAITFKESIKKFIVLKIETSWKTEKEHQINMITSIII